MANILDVLPDDMIIEVLDRLQPYQLVSAFRTNKRLLKYKYLYQDKLDEYKEIKEDLRDVSASVDKSIKNAITWISSRNLYGRGFNTVCILSPEMTRAMDLTGFYHIVNPDGEIQAIYTLSMLIQWWNLYIISRNLFAAPKLIRPDQLMDNLFSTYANVTGYQNGQLFRWIDLSKYLKPHMDCNYEPVITEEIAAGLYKEKKDLDEMF